MRPHPPPQSPRLPLRLRDRNAKGVALWYACIIITSVRMLIYPIVTLVQSLKFNNYSSKTAFTYGVPFTPSTCRPYPFESRRGGLGVYRTLYALFIRSCYGFTVPGFMIYEPVRSRSFLSARRRTCEPWPLLRYFSSAHTLFYLFYTLPLRVTVYSTQCALLCC